MRRPVSEPLYNTKRHFFDNVYTGPKQLTTQELDYLSRLKEDIAELELKGVSLSRELFPGVEIHFPFGIAAGAAYRGESAVDVAGNPKPYSKRHLMETGAYFLEYNALVDPNCIVRGVNAYNDQHHNNMQLVPRVSGDKLYGFAVIPLRIGVGYTGMDRDITKIADDCKP
ncbi:MAG: hypothetical protein HY364_04390 [Candidatus Aenigmarchaeota archaeon]|nr:hypothetical protein [Candidatus Aenigmarchaeota archaeon]